MAALHHQRIGNTPIHFVGRHHFAQVLLLVEFYGRLIGYVVQIREFLIFRLPSHLDSRPCLVRKLMHSLLLHISLQLLRQITPQIGQQTAWNEISVSFIYDFYTLTAVRRIAQFRQLSVYILRLRLLCLLMFKHDHSLLSVCLQPKPVIRQAIRHRQVNLSFSRLTCHQLFKRFIIVAIQSGSRLQVFGHTHGKQAVAHGLVHPETFQFMFRVDETQPISIGKCRRPGHTEAVATYFLHLAHILPHGLGRIKAGYVGLASMKKIGCKATIERFLQIGFKVIFHPPM